MVVFTAICASLYAAILIPFKVIPIIPGVTEFRPANAVPVVCSFLFGPAAAWGSAIGNVIGDFFGGLGPGDLFGFIGNFLYGLVPYKVWEAIAKEEPVLKTPLAWVKFTFAVFLASGLCALTIGWGINLLGFVPFSVLGNIILINNFVVAIILSPLLLAVLYPRVQKGHLLYHHFLPRRPPRPQAMRVIGLLLLMCATVGGLIMGNLISGGRWTPPLLAHLGIHTQTRAAEVGLGLLPFIILACCGLLLL
jgi:energy-coupling factor transport system substrate-specific component